MYFAAIVAMLFKEVTGYPLVWIWGLHHKRKFIPGTVNMIKTHIQEVTGPRAESTDFVLLNDLIVKLPAESLYLCYLYLYSWIILVVLQSTLQETY